MFRPWAAASPRAPLNPLYRIIVNGYKDRRRGWWLKRVLPLTTEIEETLIGLEIPYLNVILALLAMFIVVVVTGLLAANLFGRKLVAMWESLLGRIPLVRSIYQSAKQIAETMFSSSGKSFRKVLLIEYPRKGLYTLAFQTGNSIGEVQTKTDEEVTSVFVPTTPNPTSGFLILVPTKEVVELDMSVDEALKMVISLGMVEPGWPIEKLQKPPSDIA